MTTPLEVKREVEKAFRGAFRNALIVKTRPTRAEDIPPCHECGKPVPPIYLAGVGWLLPYACCACAVCRRHHPTPDELEADRRRWKEEERVRREESESPGRAASALAFGEQLALAPAQVRGLAAEIADRPPAPATSPSGPVDLEDFERELERTAAGDAGAGGLLHEVRAGDAG